MTMSAPDRNREAAAHRPQDADEGDGGQHRGRQAADEVERRFGGDPHVLRQPVLRILVRAGDEIELVVAASIEPAVEQMLG
jgi:hypothetical protein